MTDPGHRGDRCDPIDTARSDPLRLQPSASDRLVGVAVSAPRRRRRRRRRPAGPEGAHEPPRLLLPRHFPPWHGSPRRRNRRRRRRTEKHIKRLRVDNTYLASMLLSNDYRWNNSSGIKNEAEMWLIKLRRSTPFTRYFEEIEFYSQDIHISLIYHVSSSRSFKQLSNSC